MMTVFYISASRPKCKKLKNRKRMQMMIATAQFSVAAILLVFIIFMNI